MTFHQLERRTRRMDKPIGLPALIVLWTILLLALAVMVWCFFATATAPEPQYK